MAKCSQLTDLQLSTETAYSIETAYCFTSLLHMYNDLLLAVDKWKEAVLVIHDYSAAFDTINHEVFINRLAERYGITDCALRWFSIHFQNRTKNISVDDLVSQPHIPLEDVPQTTRIGYWTLIFYNVYCSVRRCH